MPDRTAQNGQTICCSSQRLHFIVDCNLPALIHQVPSQITP